MLVAIHPVRCTSIFPEASQRAASIKEGSYNRRSVQSIAYYFDVEAKLWAPLPFVAQSDEETSSYFCAERSENYLFVARQKHNKVNSIERYDVVNNSWVELPEYGNNHKVDCLCSVGDYLYAISESNPPQRYSLTNNSWQGGVRLEVEERCKKFSTVSATVMNSKIYVIHGYQRNESGISNTRWVSEPAVVHCFDPKYNLWKKLASTCHPHFESSLLVVNNRLCVAGGWDHDSLFRKPAPVEVYDEAANTWSVVPQKHISPNNLGAVEIEGRVYFIINKFPVDSGIRIPPEEMYQVDLSGWGDLAKVERGTVLCYLPVNMANLSREKNSDQGWHCY